MLVNPTKPAAAIDEAIRKVRDIDSGTLIQKNQQFMDYLQNGVEVSYMHNGEAVNDIVYLIDFAHPDRNTFQAINQWTYVEKSEKRADIMIFVNGLPLSSWSSNRRPERKPTLPPHTVKSATTFRKSRPYSSTTSSA